MAALILPSRRVWQPQGPVEVDQSNPDSAGLLLAVNHAVGLINFARRGVITPSGNPGILKARRSGFQLESFAYVFSYTPPTALTAATIYSVESLAGDSGGPWRTNETENDFAPFSDGNVYLNTFASSRYISGQPFASFADRNGFVVAARGSGVANSHAAFINGRKIGSTSSAFVCNASIQFGSNGYSSASSSALRLLFDRAHTDEQVARISRNPWALFRPIQRRLLVPVSSGGASHSLDAAAQAAAAATAALTVQASAQLAGSAQAQAGASAALLKGVTLAAASIAQAGASASLAHGVPLAASAAAVAASSGGLALGVTLAASAIATAAASAGLTVTQQNSLSANAAAQASGSAVLSLQVLLSAAAVAQAAAAATASVGKTLAANAVGQAGGSAALQVGAATDLGAAAQAQASAGAQLAVEIPLTAQALAQAMAAGSLTVSVRLQADALARSSATAVLSEEARLSAGAVAMASSSALLQVLPEGVFTADGRVRLGSTVLGQAFPRLGGSSLGVPGRLGAIVLRGPGSRIGGSKP